jgi:hypothetical protein
MSKNLGLEINKKDRVSPSKEVKHYAADIESDDSNTKREKRLKS